MYRIEKIMSGDTELLPDIVDTSIWKDYDEVNCSKSKRIIAALYKAIEQRENYYQLNSPTAFGDPQYRYYCGLVVGILQGSEMEEISNDNLIVIKRNNEKILSLYSSLFFQNILPYIFLPILQVLACPFVSLIHLMDS